MKLISKIKQKIIHWCGGYTEEELLSNRKKVEIIKTIYPIEKIQFSHRYFINETPKQYMDNEAANYLTKEIIKRGFYKSRTESSKESPGLVITYYSIYVALPPKD